MLYMPPNNSEAMVHYEHTIQQRVPLEQIARHASSAVVSRLKTIFGTHKIPVWGSQAGPQNQRRFELMAEGDVVLIVVGDSIKLMGKIAGKLTNKALSRELWQPLRGQGDTTWELIYFIASPVEIDLPFAELRSLFGYETTYRLQGFSSISDERLDQFYTSYEDLYSVLMRIKAGEQLEKRRTSLPEGAEPESAPVRADELEQVPPTEHTRMQYLLSKLGKKAGERIWVPPGDQTRIRNSFEFEGFDTEFTAAIDLPKSYVENIDVVWKQEYRIDAAYEVENSTAIYSGLLRFADLAIMAPNSMYPMFIVAPAERRTQVRDQVLRPAFKEMGLHTRVRFLTYEAVDEIDRLVGAAESGLTVKLVEGKSERFATL